jgi:hypothetical protein
LLSNIPRLPQQLLTSGLMMFESIFPAGWISELRFRPVLACTGTLSESQLTPLPSDLLGWLLLMVAR